MSLYIDGTSYISCHSSRGMPVNRPTTLDQPTVNHRTTAIRCGYTHCNFTLQDSAWMYSACWLSLTPCWLVTNYIIFRTSHIFSWSSSSHSTTARHGSRNTSTWCCWRKIEPNDRRFNQCATWWNTGPIQAPVITPWRSNCCHRQFDPGHTFNTNTWHLKYQENKTACNQMLVNPDWCRQRSTYNIMHTWGALGVTLPIHRCL